MRTWLIRGLAAAVLSLCTMQVAAQSDPSFEQAVDATRGVATPYFEAYIARDWDRLAPLLSDAGGFTDPTAAFVFGPVKHEGKDATMKNFREGYAAIKHMAFHQTRVFVSGEHAVFEGTLDWTLELSDGKQAVTRAMPFMTILRVVDGKVIEHRDYADYAPFLQAVRAARKGA